jgi:hypothetical protein
MSLGESVDFADYHRWRLERIIELTDRLSGVAKPTWAFSLSADKKLQLDPSVVKDAAEKQTGLDSKEQEGLDNFLEARRYAAHLEISTAYAIGIMYQAKGLSQKEVPVLDLPDPDPGLTLMRCSDAGFIMHEFTSQDTGAEYEASRAWITAAGLNDQVIKVETVSLQKTDDLLSERLSIRNVEGELGVFRQVNPVKDELLERLIEVSQISLEGADWALYNAGFAALIGAPDAEQMLSNLSIQGPDEELENLIVDMRERLKMVRASRSMNFNQGLPTQDQLDHIIELLEEMAEV